MHGRIHGYHLLINFFFSSRRRHTRCSRDWSSDVCSSDLERLERMRDSGDFGRITKKEGLILMREIERLEGLLSGVRKLVRPPDMLFVVDVSREGTAIHEANLLKIPVVAMVDTNCDPSDGDYVIPSNDDAIRAIKLVVGKIADAALEGLGA